MEKISGNHIGIVVNTQDPENRGRVQVFIPHISTTLYKNWNQKLKNISFRSFTDSVFDADVKERLLSVLPWAEAAVPIWGGGTGAPVNQSTGSPVPFPTDQVISSNADPETIKNGIFQASAGTPWSGGFISSIASSSGKNFPSNLAHAGYVESISKGNNPDWQSFNPSTTPPKVGDVLVGNRTQGSHGDVITDIAPDGTLTVIGGNVSNTVKQYTKKISSNDFAIIRPTDENVASNMVKNAQNEYNLWSSNGWNESSPEAIGRLSQYYAMQPVSSNTPSNVVSGKSDPRQWINTGLERKDGSMDPSSINVSASGEASTKGDTSNMSPAFKAQYERVLNSLNGSKFDPATNGGKSIIPDDGKTYGITTGSKEEWAHLFTRMASVESSFNSQTSSGPSYGLYQMGEDAWRVYGNDGNIYNPDDNTKSFINYAENLYFGSKYGNRNRIAFQDPSLSSSWNPGGWGGISTAYGPVQRASSGNFLTNNEKQLLAENMMSAEKNSGSYTGGSDGSNMRRTTSQALMATGSYHSGRIGGPAGMFSCPAVGAKVWVFFQAENPQRPVYFANVYEPSNAIAAG